MDPTAPSGIQPDGPPGYGPPTQPQQSPPAWAMWPTRSAPVRSARQWEAYIRSQLGKGVSIATLLNEMAPNGPGYPAAYQTAYWYILGHLASLRRRAWILVGVGTVGLLLGASLFFGGDTTDRDAVRGAAFLGALGLTFLGTGLYRLVRLPHA